MMAGQRQPIILLCLLAFTACAGIPGVPTPRQDSQRLFTEAQKALDARDYPGAISLLTIFVERFPDSESYSWALQRLGESFEGLLATQYREPLAEGTPEPSARDTFLERFGHFGCWETGGPHLAYDRRHFQQIIDDYPDSPIADEAAYHLIEWQQPYSWNPDGPRREIAALDEMLQRYPDSSLRGDILYQMAYRCHVLAEIYTYAPRSVHRDSQQAAHYRQQARYLYRLAASGPQHTRQAEQAWRYLQKLERNERIYHGP